jgi:hypothetical protein
MKTSNEDCANRFEPIDELVGKIDQLTVGLQPTKFVEPVEDEKISCLYEIGEVVTVKDKEFEIIQTDDHLVLRPVVTSSNYQPDWAKSVVEALSSIIEAVSARNYGDTLEPSDISISSAKKVIEGLIAHDIEPTTVDPKTDGGFIFCFKSDHKVARIYVHNDGSIKMVMERLITYTKTIKLKNTKEVVNTLSSFLNKP